MRSPPQLLPVEQGYLEIEETAANAFMLRQAALQETRRSVDLLEKFVRSQPRGYREAIDATGDQAFDDAVRETMRSYTAVWAEEYNLDLGSPALDLQRILPLSREDALSACPVYVISDLELIGLTPATLRLVTAIKEIDETEEFRKAFAKQPQNIQQAWHRKRDLLRNAIPPGADFKPMKNRRQRIYSIRLNKSYRVHLRPPPQGQEAWTAFEIGNHKEMGHG